MYIWEPQNNKIMKMILDRVLYFLKKQKYLKLKFYKNPIFRDKIFVLVSLGVIWILFFDSGSLLEHLKINNKIKHHESQIKHYNSQVWELKENYYKLKNDKKALERFARERFKMKKKGEEIFEIVNEDDLD